MNKKDYSPYCGNNLARTNPKGCDNPRTVFNGKQFECPHCDWVSEFPEEFVKEYKSKWNK